MDLQTLRKKLHYITSIQKYFSFQSISGIKMEHWQKFHINSNIHKLVKATNVREPLLRWLQSQNILSIADIEQIKCKSDRFKKASQLFDIVQTRINGYSALARALAHVKQTGALDILLKGFSEHVLPAIKIQVFGNIKPLSEYFEPDEITEIIQKVTKTLTPNEYIKFYDDNLSSKYAINLLKDTIPPEAPFYIPRSLSKRLTLNPDIFKVKCSDVFVFRDFDAIQLDKLVRPNRTAPSTTQVENISCRFIFLESDEDWEVIRENVQDPAHLIQFVEKSSTFVLQSTTGGSTIIHEYLEQGHSAKDNSNNDCISEDDFVNEIFQNEACREICICDSPGMGKTHLLASLARKVNTKYHHDRIVAFIQLNQFTKQIVESNKSQKLKEKLNVRNQLLQHISPFPVILEYLVAKKNISLELFFDAFDEIPHQHSNIAKSLLTEILKMPKTRVCVTSRLHVRNQLEGMMSTIAYNIMPFSKRNKIDFLVNFWKNEHSASCETKLSEFARFRVNKFQEGLSKQEKDITGVPLQCRLLAQVYARKAKMYAQSKRSMPPPEEKYTFEQSLPELYNSCIKYNFKKLAQQHSAQEIDEIKLYHAFISLKTLFPSEAMKNFSKLISGTIIDEISILSVGLLEKQSSDVEEFHFVHRTFAEYFAALVFAKAVGVNQDIIPSAEIPTKKMLKFLFRHVLFTGKTTDRYGNEEAEFKHAVLVFFLDKFLTKFPVNSELKQVFTSAFTTCFTGEMLYRVLLASLRHNFANIFELVNKILLDVGRIYILRYKLKLCVPDRIERFLLVAAKYSNVVSVEKLCLLFKKSFSYDWTTVANEIRSPTLLAIAIQKADYEMVQYFLDTQQQRSNLQESFYDGIMDSNKDSLEIVQLKIKICKLLLDRKKGLLTKNIRMLSYSRNVHLELLKFLIKDGPRSRIVSKRIVHNVTYYMDSDGLHEFYRFLIDDCHLEALFASDGKLENSLHFILSRWTVDVKCETVKMILDAIPARYSREIQDSSGNDNLIMFAVSGRRNADTLITLLRWFGLNIKRMCKDKDGKTFLHLASEYLTRQDYHKLINYLCETSNTDLFSITDNSKKLPVHLALEHINISQATLKLFYENNVNFNSVDKQGQSLLVHAVKGRKDVRILNTLMELGTDPGIRDAEGETFVHAMSRYYKPAEYHGIVQWLISRGLGEMFGWKSNGGKTPLHCAVGNMKLLPETLHLLIGQQKHQDFIVDLNAPDTDGLTVFHVAVKKKRSLAFVRLLIELGADWSAVTNVLPPWWHTLDFGAPDILCEVGCKINQIDN